MSNKRQSVEYDKAGNPYIDAPRKNSAKKVRVSFVREWYTPPMSETGEVDYERAARELGKEITGGTLRFSSYLEDGSLGFAAEAKITRRSELDAFICAVRAVFKEGVRQGNEAREAGLARCAANLKGEESAVGLPERTMRRGRDRRARSDRRVMDRRSIRVATPVDLRRHERRAAADRRRGGERRAA